MPRRTAVPAPSEEEVMRYDNVPVEVAAPYVGLSAPSLYLGLQQGRAPFGWAVQNEKGGGWTYNISPGGLVKYKREGCPIITLAELRELMADSAKEVLDAKMRGLSLVMNAVLDA